LFIPSNPSPFSLLLIVPFLQDQFLLDKLETQSKALVDIQAQLSSPDLATDEMIRLSKVSAELQKTVDLYNEYKETVVSVL